MTTLVDSTVSDDVRARVRRSLQDFHPEGTKVLSEAFAAGDLSASLSAVDTPPKWYMVNVINALGHRSQHN